MYGSGRHRQPVCRGAVLHPTGQTFGGVPGHPYPPHPGQRRQNRCHGLGGAAAAQQAESLCSGGDQAGVLAGTAGRSGCVQTLLYHPGGLDGSLRPDPGKPCPEAGGAVPDSGGLQCHLPAGKDGPPGSYDLGAGGAGSQRLREVSPAVCGRLPGLYPAAFGDSGIFYPAGCPGGGEPSLRHTGKHRHGL